MAKRFRFEATVERHHPELPVYVVVPAEVAEGLGKTGTFVVQAAAEDQDIGRRSVKPWGDGRWFLELTQPQCARLNIRVGSRIAFRVCEAEAMPADLAVRLADLELMPEWNGLTEAQRRAFAESVFDAKKPATRQTRIERAVASLRTG